MHEAYIDACLKNGEKIELLIREVYKKQPNRRVFIDGGLHKGYHSNFAARHFSDRIIGIEASPAIFIDFIKQKTSAAKQAGECEIFPVNAALGCRAKQGDTAQFFYSPTHPGRSTVNTKMWEQWGKGSVEYQAPILAPIVEIDDLVQLYAGSGNVDFIKLDLEGNEINALNGAQKTLLEHRPNLVMEFGLKPGNEDLFGETLQDFQGFLEKMGYRAFAPWAEDVTDTLATKAYPFWYIFLLPEGDALAPNREHLAALFEHSAKS